MKKRDPLQPERCAEILGALAAPERLRIIRLLMEGERNVSEIIEMARIAALNVSHHLTVLKHANLIRSEKRGRFVIYSITSTIIDEVITAGVPKDALDLGCCQLVLPENPNSEAKNKPC